MVERIRTTGVGVIGDLDILGDPALAKDVGDLPADVAVPADVVARLAAGLVKIAAETPARKAPADRRIGDLEAGLRHRLVAERERRRIAEVPTVEDASVGDLVRHLGARLARRIRVR